ncbi:hypothetical protein [Fimbriiglobus ruber]|uniref:Uncharacterized protein n=1 Tax=Fimbriiglobus ruber TaxID=1908690 RepID=A0A225DWN0_9BACT|nr:hypothetical protein [Fimbriiglobus ruber]OWK45802.1 hypothetical protein FRUB_02133 [Fimbriiglobus ruber]
MRNNPERFFRQHVEIRFSNEQAALREGPYLSASGDKYVIVLPDMPFPDYVLREELIHLQKAIDREGYGPAGARAYRALIENYDAVKSTLKNTPGGNLAIADKIRSHIPLTVQRVFYVTRLCRCFL